MEYIDRIYGQAIIDEPVILDLLALPEMQRLKGIDQVGYYEPQFPGTKHYRWEHSIGVYLLLRKYEAPLEEQIAGLIHDVSHSAFSHCIDYALAQGSEKEQSHQDNVFEEYVRRSRIPAALQAHGIDVEYILDDGNFPLKENNIPDLCADRIDYAFREMAVYRIIPAGEIRRLLESLTVDRDRWVFENGEAGKRFAEVFKIFNDRYLCGFPTAIMFRTVGDVLKHSLDQKYISSEDLYSTDDHVLKKIKLHLEADENLKRYWDRMHLEHKAVNDPANYETQVFCKSRVVDPLCRVGSGIRRVSDIYPDWKGTVARELKPKEYFLRFEG